MDEPPHGALTTATARSGVTERCPSCAAVRSIDERRCPSCGLTTRTATAASAAQATWEVGSTLASAVVKATFVVSVLFFLLAAAVAALRSLGS